ncbi:CIC11C00000004661 [Sungouiella intermedia]|uniref:CIC11C00000001699 n=1 Tax=Sungouiella intermedia TaxID=45354 RepID=A0A1L0BKJ4_9ASCO|nr:CIC11C00000004661 [[Candida] intermedia]SGZ52102.1 CIC11C00000001699 [[Candida] intermedia]
MYQVAEPQNFIDIDIDFESEWNPHYLDSYVDTPESPLSQPQTPVTGLMYECNFCLQEHSPSMPCNSNYVFLLPQLASYTYASPFQEEKQLDDGIVESNYRKWLVSVTPR